MGTDYIILVYYNGDIVLAKCAGHDGYPDQILPEIAEFINKIRKDRSLRHKFLSRVQNIELIHDEDIINEFQKDMKARLEKLKQWPKLNDDMLGIIANYLMFDNGHAMFDNELGVYILNEILEDEEPIKHLVNEYCRDNHCHRYEIDFDNDTITVDYDHVFDFCDFKEDNIDKLVDEINDDDE